MEPSYFLFSNEPVDSKKGPLLNNPVLQCGLPGFKFKGSCVFMGEIINSSVEGQA